MRLIIELLYHFDSQYLLKKEGKILFTPYLLMKQNQKAKKHAIRIINSLICSKVPHY